MSGTGLRTYSSGRVAAGRWEGGQLASPLELWQCANAAEGAAEAALAARRWVVEGGCKRWFLCAGGFEWVWVSGTVAGSTWR